ncbi:hypothetical protein NEAUS07_2687, partial [Nematocida ausubeli]
RIFGSSCLFLSSGYTFFVFPVYTEHLNIFIIFLFGLYRRILLVCTRVSYKHSRTHTLLCALHCHLTLLVHLLVPLTTLTNTTRIPLIDLFLYVCSLCMLIFGSSCLFCACPLFLLFFFVFPLHTIENTWIFLVRAHCCIFLVYTPVCLAFGT